MAIWPPSRWWRDEPEETRHPGAPGVVAEEHVERAPDRPTGDWSMLAPIQRTVGPAPTTFRSTTVRDIMPSHHNPSFTGPLGHSVSARAPSGTVTGLATTIDAGTATPSIVQRDADLPLRAPTSRPAQADGTPPLRRLAAVEPIVASGARMVASPVMAPMPEAPRPLAGAGVLPGNGRPPTTAMLDADARADGDAADDRLVDRGAATAEPAGTAASPASQASPAAPLISGTAVWAGPEVLEGLEGPPLAPVQRVTSVDSTLSARHLEPPIQPLAVRRRAGAAPSPSASRPVEPATEPMAEPVVRSDREHPATPPEPWLAMAPPPDAPLPLAPSTDVPVAGQAPVAEVAEAAGPAFGADPRDPREIGGRDEPEAHGGLESMQTPAGMPEMPLQRAVASRPPDTGAAAPVPSERGTRLGLGAPLHPVGHHGDLPLAGRTPAAGPSAGTVPPGSVSDPGSRPHDHGPEDLTRRPLDAPEAGAEGRVPAPGPLLPRSSLDDHDGPPVRPEPAAPLFALRAIAPAAGGGVAVQRAASAPWPSPPTRSSPGEPSPQPISGPDPAPRSDFARDRERPLLGGSRWSVPAASTPPPTPTANVQRALDTASHPSLRLAAPPVASSARPWAGSVDAGQAAIDAGVAQREADGSIVFHLPAAPPGLRSDDDPDSHIQRAVMSDAPTSPTATATTPATAAALAGASGADANLDQMANQLYDRIRWRLRSELRREIDRTGRGAGF